MANRAIPAVSATLDSNLALLFFLFFYCEGIREPFHVLTYLYINEVNMGEASYSDTFSRKACISQWLYQHTQQSQRVSLATVVHTSSLSIQFMFVWNSTEMSCTVAIQEDKVGKFSINSTICKKVWSVWINLYFFLNKTTFSFWTAQSNKCHHFALT